MANIDKIPCAMLFGDGRQRKNHLMRHIQKMKIDDDFIHSWTILIIVLWAAWTFGGWDTLMLFVTIIGVLIILTVVGAFPIRFYGDGG